MTTNPITVFSTDVYQSLTNLNRDCEFSQFYAHFLAERFNSIRVSSIYTKTRIRAVTGYLRT